MDYTITAFSEKAYKCVVKYNYVHVHQLYETYLFGFRRIKNYHTENFKYFCAIITICPPVYLRLRMV